jgi:GlpG protein
MPAFRALETQLGAELAEFSRYLWAQRVPHRVFDAADGRQVLMVAREQDVQTVRDAFARWRRGELDLASAAPAPARSPRALHEAWRSQPLTVLTVLCCLLVALMLALDPELRVLHWLSFTDFTRLPGDRLAFEKVAVTYARGEYWRLFTPVLLHFGVLHLAFNMLWFWDLGRRIERVRGSATLLALLAITGVGGNIAQYVIDGSVMFGGMSGVIYGLLGYAWMWNRFSGAPGLALPRGVLAALLVWLVVCMSGFVEAIGFGAIANAAHGAGLVLGMLLGLGSALLYSPPSAARP